MSARRNLPPARGESAWERCKGRRKRKDVNREESVRKEAQGRQKGEGEKEKATDGGASLERSSQRSF
jgi:hypothetical protein